MQTFTVNEFISLTLRDTQTSIRINGKFFIQCRYLIISIPTQDIEGWDGYDSIDEIIKATGKTEGDRKAFQITPEEEFWGHCSNLQTWAENNYDYRILDSQLSIPIITEILKGLTKKKDRERFRSFFMKVVSTLDDYIINSLDNEATHDKFKFFRKAVCRTKGKYFSAEEISGSILLKQIYDRYIDEYLLEREKQREYYRKFGKFKAWEAKIWGTGPENLKYRYHLRLIRNFISNNKHLLNSDERDYLPYLYAKGRFKDVGSISMCYLRGGGLIIRDEEGKYWEDTENHYRGTDYG